MRRRIFLVTAIGLFLGSVCLAQATKTTTVTFYHTSDLHDHSKPLPRIARLVAEAKKKDANTLFVDTGDWCNKGDLTDLNTRGEAIVEMMAASGYDAVITGNHDFTFGGQRLVELVNRHSMPLLAANCQWDESIKPKNVCPYRIFKLEGVTVGVIGTAPPFVGEEKGPLVKILPIARSIGPIVDELAAKTDIIVLLTHIGIPEDKKLITALPRVDIVFGGHHHKRFNSLTFDKKNQTVHQYSGPFGEYVGKVTLTWDGTKIVDRKAELVKVTPKMLEAEDVKAVADKYFAKK